MASLNARILPSMIDDTNTDGRALEEHAVLLLMLEQRRLADLVIGDVSDEPFAVGGSSGSRPGQCEPS